jgi:S-DNA-T family DNA segregation ATPase FtsK/SpoIIIE
MGFEPELDLTLDEPLTPIKPRRKRKPSAARAMVDEPSQTSSRRSTEQHVQGKEELHGIFLIAVAIIFFLSLFSYEPKDLPTWAWLNPSGTQNAKPANCMGIFGTFLGFYSQVLVGSAVYVGPFCLAWFGVCKLLSRARISARAWLSVPLLLITGAALMDVTGVAPDNSMISPMGPGGALGKLIGGRILSNLFGAVGASLILGGVYALGLIFVSGLKPLAVLTAVRQELPVLARAAWAWLRNGRQASAPALEPYAMDDLAGSKPRNSRAKAITPSSIGSSTATEPPVTAILGQQLDLPMPQIIDSSAPKAITRDETKPTLSEVWARKRQAKLEQSGTAPAGSLSERFKNYQLPPLDLLHWPEMDETQVIDTKELIHIQEIIIHCLASFGITVTKGDITRGPAITRYEVKPIDGLRVSRIAGLDMDIARATKAERINILAPIPGKDTVGIELANRNKVIVPIRELLEDDIFQNGKAKLPIALGKDVYGKTIIADLAAMPHLLVAGATGSGKSVCINGIITSLIARFAPDELRFVMIDPKVVEMQVYADVPHLALPVVTDPKKALMALRWVVKEMETRYQIFATEGVRNFESFNNRNREKKSASRNAGTAKTTSVNKTPAAVLADEDMPPWEEAISTGSAPLAEIESTSLAVDQEFALHGEPESSNSTRADLTDANGDWAGDSYPPDRPHRSQEQVIPDNLPFIVVIIDELADLMQTAPADIEQSIARITQMARAAGIHLIIATQTPRADVITGVIKANVPSRIAFQVASAIDSRVILDRKGAENLVGKGDMLYLPPGTSTLVRSQGALVTDEEIHAIVDYCAKQGTPLFDAAGEGMAGIAAFSDEEDEEEEDAEDLALMHKCLDVMRAEGKASTSLFQRRLGIGYGKAARMMDMLEERDIIGPADGSKLREILVQLD